MNIDAIVRDHGKMVFNLAYRITGSHQDAQDATQDTFLQVYRGLDRFRGESSLATWIYRIAVNASLQTKNKLDKTYIDSLDETILQFKDDIPEEVRKWSGNPETEYLYTELLDEVHRGCLHFITFRLTDEQRVVYILRVMFDFSLDDISAILGINKNTVKARLQRAKASLGEYFSGRCQWIENGGDCSCESRLGFALSMAPEILRKMKQRPIDAKTAKVVRSSLRQVQDLESLYRELPAEDFETEELVKLLHTA